MQPITVLELSALLFFVLYKLYNYFCGSFSIFRNQGIPGPRPVPIFGTWWRSWEHNPVQIAIQQYKKYGKLYGSFRGRIPVLHIYDVDLLRSVFVKDAFEHFPRRNRRPVTSENAYVNKTLSMLHGDQWKALRTLVIGAFSPQVVKERVYFANETFEAFVQQWKNIANTKGVMDLKDETEMLCGEIMMNYTTGMKLDSVGSHSHSDASHEFVVNARKAMEAGEKSFIGTVAQLYPQLRKWFRPLRDTEDDYFISLSKRIIQERKDMTTADESGINSGGRHVTQEPDLIDRLLDCMNSNGGKASEHVDDVVAIAQVSSTLLTGYSLGTVLTRVLHCLAVNTEAQAKCRAEIQAARERNNGEVSFELLSSLPYLEWCVKEALRIYPTTFMTTRICTKPIKYGDLKISEGTAVECPVYIIQRDPDIYPDPMKFMPERFAPENAKQRDPILFLPFGQGPRSCFAQKFSITLLVQCLVHMLPMLKFCPTQGTKDPLELSTGPSGMLTARNVLVGVKWLGN